MVVGGWHQSAGNATVHKVQEGGAMKLWILSNQMPLQHTT